MDHNFLNYYNKELTFMREMSRIFAEKHPKIAGRLGMQGIEVADPYVERLIESFCFLAARTQIKLDAGFPDFTQRLLNVVYPNYTAPTPSMCVVQLQPSLKEGNLTSGYCVKRNSAVFTQIVPGEDTRCEFRTGQDVQLWPVKITQVQLGSLPPDIPDMDKYRINTSRLKAAMRIHLQLPGDLKFSQLEGFDRLPVYIDGDERIVSHIFELLHSRHVASIIRHGHGNNATDTVINSNIILLDNLSPQESLLPTTWNGFHGHNLLHEYFSCRQRFYFFTLMQLAEGMKNNHTNQAEIIILLDDLSPELTGMVSEKNFLLYCTPVINLFSKRIDRVEINRAQNEFHVVADRSRPLDFEIYAITKVFGQQAETSKEIAFRPLYHTRHQDNKEANRYFSVSRKNRPAGTNHRKYKTRTLYNGTEVFLSIVDQRDAPYSDDIRYLSLEALTTNRDLPRLLCATDDYVLMMPDSAPVRGARFVFQPSSPQPPFASGESAWRLIRQLSLNYLPLHDMDHSKGGEALRTILQLYVSNSDHPSLRQIDSLVGCKSEPVTSRLPGNGLLIYGRGIRCTLTVDEDGFSGISPYLFGMVMENYLSRHVAINTFTETEMISMQRGRIAHWRPRAGHRGCL
ncbi:type VI secretion system baseplate subunit TssF [Enterobacteriaceae bacterium 4M9]|nr:type VI secretion system baseplate subunit TssF [Enterobacteriaceae bacterium 4M9]